MEEQHIIFRVIEFFLKNPNINPTLNQLREELTLSSNEGAFLGNIISVNYSNSNNNHILFSSSGGANLAEAPLQLLPSAIIAYNEFLEIKMARENAHQAMVQSSSAHALALTAFWVSLIVGILQVVVSIFDVKI